MKGGIFFPGKGLTVWFLEKTLTVNKFGLLTINIKAVNSLDPHKNQN